MCYLSVIVLFGHGVAYPYSSTDLTLELHILSLALDLISFGFHKFPQYYNNFSCLCYFYFSIYVCIRSCVYIAT